VDVADECAGSGPNHWRAHCMQRRGEGFLARGCQMGDSQLKAYFGAEVHVQYYDLFDADRPPLPANAQLPLVMVNSEVFSIGGKISVPAIRCKIEEMLEQEKLPETKSADLRQVQ